MRASDNSLNRHPGESREPDVAAQCHLTVWAPACAGVTNFDYYKLSTKRHHR
jgi:hypothetical protein